MPHPLRWAACFAPAAAPAAPPKPILAVDVDGVVSPMGAEEPAGGGVRFELIAGRLRRISLGAGDCLRSLTGAFELVWASGWGREKYESLARILALGAHGGERALAWVDDNHTTSPQPRA